MSIDSKFFFRYLKEKSLYIAFLSEVKANKSIFSILNAVYKGDLKPLIKNEPSITILYKAIDWSTSKLGPEFWNKQFCAYLSYYDKNFHDYYNINGKKS